MHGGLLMLLLQAAMAVTLLAPPIVQAQTTGSVEVMDHCLSSTLDCLPCATCPLASGYTPANAHGSDTPGAAAPCAVAATPPFGAAQSWAVTSAAPMSMRIHLLYCRWLN
jgi:hypothetical protein